MPATTTSPLSPHDEPYSYRIVDEDPTLNDHVQETAPKHKKLEKFLVTVFMCIVVGGPSLALSGPVGLVIALAATITLSLGGPPILSAIKARFFGTQSASPSSEAVTDSGKEKNLQVDYVSLSPGQ